MTFRRRQFLGWALLAVLLAAGGGWLLRLDYAQRISTDVLDLVPAEQAAPELALVRQLAGEAEARTVLCELTVDGHPAPAAAAIAFAEALGRSPAYDQAIFLGDQAMRDAVAGELFAQRLPLLFPRWLREQGVTAANVSDPALPAQLTSTATASLTRFLATSEALAFQDLLPADPLLLLPAAVERMRGGLALVSPPSAASPPTVVWARLRASPLSEAGQGPAFAALVEVTAQVGRDWPGLRVADTGVNRFAAASRARIEREVKWLNTASLIAVLAVALLFIRQIHRGLHLIPVVLFAILGAWVGTTLSFPRVHVLVFVFGSLLTGVAIDYGFYLFMQPPLFPGEDYWAKVRRLAKPLLASCLTTVAGFALLLGSDLPFIRQLGVFVGTGLVCALAAAVIYFSTVRQPFLATREFPAVGRGGATRRRLRGGLVVAWIAALPGLALLQWRDDIRELEVASPALQREDARIRGLAGEQHATTVYVTYGRDLAAARAALEKFDDWHAQAGADKDVISLGAIVPTTDDAAVAGDFVRLHPEFARQLRDALATAGFDAAEFDGFAEAFDRYAGDMGPTVVARALAKLRASLTGPLALLVHEGQPYSWFVTLAADDPGAAPPPGIGTVSSSQLQTLNAVFAQYRRSALRLSAIGLAIVGIGVLLTYGLRDGLRIFAIPCGVCLGLFGAFGWAGYPLNLFHLLGAFLGVCLTHNYSIFSATSAYRGEAPPASVRLSALTTAASFGVLALSSIPVVRALGLTVALMVVSALTVIELEHLSGLGRKP